MLQYNDSSRRIYGNKRFIANLWQDPLEYAFKTVYLNWGFSTCIQYFNIFMNRSSKRFIIFNCVNAYQDFCCYKHSYLQTFSWQLTQGSVSRSTETNRLVNILHPVFVNATIILEWWIFLMELWKKAFYQPTAPAFCTLFALLMTRLCLWRILDNQCLHSEIHWSSISYKKPRLGSAGASKLCSQSRIGRVLPITADQKWINWYYSKGEGW
jgi:hypothetical protein